VLAENGTELRPQEDFVKRFLSAGFGLAASAALSCAALAQSAVTNVAVSAGSATDERGVRSDAVTLAPSVVFLTGVNSNFILSGTATRFANSAWQLGLGGALNARSSEAAGFALAFNGSGNVAQASFNATFAQADATPSLQWSAGPLTLIGGAHAATGYTAVSTPNVAPPAPGAPAVPAGSQLTSQTRTSIAPSYGAELRLFAGSPVVAQLSLREEPARVGGMLVTDQLAGATISSDALTISAVAGRRDAPDERVDFASGSLSIPITRVLSITAAGGQYPSNRLTGASGGRFFSTGLSLRFGGSGMASMPQPSGARSPLSSETRLAIRAPSAERVEIAGDWNSWTPASTTRASNGVWYVDLPLKAGEYRYAFLVDGKEWRVPDGVVAVDDGFGGKAAYVTVRTTGSMLSNHNQEER
jgi:hypothetical protein